MAITVEQQRPVECRDGRAPWRRWGPCLSERQRGTVREDCSAGGDAWTCFSHDQARSRACRWGEDGLAGISDDRQLLGSARALWNGRDPILKERLFGLTNAEAGPANGSCDGVVRFAWQGRRGEAPAGAPLVAAVNVQPHRAQCCLRPPFPAC